MPRPRRSMRRFSWRASRAANLRTRPREWSARGSRSNCALAPHLATTPWPTPSALPVPSDGTVRPVSLNRDFRLAAALGPKLAGCPDRRTPRDPRRHVPARRDARTGVGKRKNSRRQIVADRRSIRQRLRKEPHQNQVGRRLDRERSRRKRRDSGYHCEDASYHGAAVYRRPRRLSRHFLRSRATPLGSSGTP